MRQLSTLLGEEELENLKSQVMKERGRVLPPKSKWELFRFEVLDYKGVVYSSGKVVYHEPLIPLIERSLIERPGIEIGSDEAGKGERSGPIVVAAVALDEDGRRFLRARGLMESKSLSKHRLLEIAGMVEGRALALSYKVVTPNQLISRWRKGKLNDLLTEWHLQVVSEVFDEVEASRIIVDSFDESRLREAFSFFESRGIEVLIESRADLKYPSVAAASVLARRIYLEKMDEGIKWT